MRRNNGTFADPDANGSGIPGFSDGDAFPIDPLDGLPLEASRLEARWSNDAQEAIKVACTMGNGEPGPLPADPNDDVQELARAVLSSPSTITGAGSFSSFASGEGLRLSVVGGLTVAISPGQYTFGGRKYHATAALLANISIDVGGVPAGDGTNFTLLASRDHYISIGPDPAEPRDSLQVQVRDVANGDPPPAVPAGTFVFSIVETGGVGVTAFRFPAHGPRVITSTSSGWSFEPPGLSGPSGALIGFPASAVNIGALATEALPDPSDGGALVGTVHAQNLHLRTHSGSGENLDRFTLGTARTTTIGAASSNVGLIDLDDLPNSSAIEIRVTVVAFSNLNQLFTETKAIAATKTSLGAMALDGAGVETIRGPRDPGAIGASTGFTLSGGNVVQFRCNGAVGHNLTWTLSTMITQMRGI